jgi:hypothetical protein
MVKFDRSSGSTRNLFNPIKILFDLKKNIYKTMFLFFFKKFLKNIILNLLKLTHLSHEASRINRVLLVSSTITKNNKIT